jgi:hypothetical protein
LLCPLHILCSGAENRKGLEKQILAKVRGSIYWLPQPYIADKLEFDASGQLIGYSETASPAMNSLVQITGLSLKSDALRVDGRRVFAVLSPPTNGTFSMVGTDFPIHVTLHLPQPISTEADAQYSWTKVFSGGDPNQKLAGLWKASFQSSEDLKALLKGDSSGVVGSFDSRPVYRPGAAKITLPRPGKSRHDYYPSVELKGLATISMILDEHGRVALMMTDNPNDPVQIAAMMSYSVRDFTPATKDGTPVACFFALEMDFHGIPK